MLPTALSGVFGFLAGLVGFGPVLFVRHQVRRAHPLMRHRALVFGLASIGISLALLVALLLLAQRFAEETFTVFAVTMIVTFLLANTIYAIWENRH